MVIWNVGVMGTQWRDTLPNLSWSSLKECIETDKVGEEKIGSVGENQRGEKLHNVYRNYKQMCIANAMFETGMVRS